MRRDIREGKILPVGVVCHDLMRMLLRVVSGNGDSDRPDLCGVICFVEKGGEMSGEKSYVHRRMGIVKHCFLCKHNAGVLRQHKEKMTN